MKAPCRQSPDEIRQTVVDWLAANTQRIDGNVSACLRCGSRIRARFVELSVHTDGFRDCTGYGTVLSTPFPYCPTCTPAPDQSGCVHVSLDAARGIALACGNLECDPGSLPS